MELETFIKALDKIEFLNIGLTSSEISDYLEELTDIKMASEELQILLKRKKLFKVDPNLIAANIAGMHFKLVKGSGNYKRRCISNEKLYYHSGNVYFNFKSSRVTRVIYEIRESNRTSFSVELLDKLNEIGPTTEQRILSYFSTSNAIRHNISNWIKKNVKNGFIVRVDKNRYMPGNKPGNELYNLSREIKASYDPSIINLWEQFKKWEYRRCFYS